MLEDNDFVKLRQLCDSYYQRQIDFASYRAQRKDILDKLEAELNRLPTTVPPSANTTQPRPKLERHTREEFAGDEQMNDESNVFPHNDPENHQEQ